MRAALSSGRGGERWSRGGDGTGGDPAGEGGLVLDAVFVSGSKSVVVSSSMSAGCVDARSTSSMTLTTSCPPRSGRSGRSARSERARRASAGASRRYGVWHHVAHVAAITAMPGRACARRRPACRACRACRTMPYARRARSDPAVRARAHVVGRWCGRPRPLHRGRLHCLFPSIHVLPLRTLTSSPNRKTARTSTSMAPRKRAPAAKKTGAVDGEPRLPGNAN